MPETALHQLADEAARAAVAPDFRHLVRRARQRQRRRRGAVVVAALGVTAVAVAAVLVPDGGPDRDNPPVSPPRPSPTQTTSAHHRYLLHHPEALVNQPFATIASVSYASREDAAALWQVCSVTGTDGQCPEVVTWTADGWRTSHAYRIPDKLGIYDLANGSVVVWLFDGGFVLDRDGHRHPVHRSGQPLAVVPGGRYVNLPGAPDGAGPPGVLDTRTGTVHRPLTTAATACLMDDQWTGGTLWELGMSRCAVHPRESVAWTSDLGRTWRTRTERRPILGIAATARRTAVLLGSSIDELTAVDVTTDGGRTWHLTRLRGPLVAPDQLAVAPDGHLFLTVGTELYEADSTWTAVHRIRQPSSGGAGISTADGVLSTYGGGARIAVSYDDGQTWHTISPRPRVGR